MFEYHDSIQYIISKSITHENMNGKHRGTKGICDDSKKE